VAWSDWASQPKTKLAHGIKLDTNYYNYPGSWMGSRPGFMTGSGLVMRFADVDGTTIDEYQAATQMSDESGQTYPANVNALLDNAVGPQGYWGVFTANMHTDLVSSPGSDAVINSAVARSVPVISAKQILDWTEGRNASSFREFSWAGNTLGFRIVANAGANGLEAMLPLQGPSGTLTTLQRGGSPVAFTTRTVKGVDYAVFNAIGGTHTAVYG
jgi:hypothetical protein